MLAGERNALASDTCPANCQGGVTTEPSFLSPSSRGPSCHDLGSEKGEDELIMIDPFPWALPPSQSALHYTWKTWPFPAWGSLLPALSLDAPLAMEGRVGNGLFFCYKSNLSSCFSNILSPSFDHVEDQEKRGREEALWFWRDPGFKCCHADLQEAMLCFTGFNL